MIRVILLVYTISAILLGSAYLLDSLSVGNLIVGNIIKVIVQILPTIAGILCAIPTAFLVPGLYFKFIKKE